MESKTLQILDLGVCRLIKINNKTFAGFPALSKLDLSGNRFTKTFKVSYFRNNQFLEEIRLYDNLWDCDCYDQDFRDFYNFYMQRRTVGSRVRETPQCGHPTNYIENTWTYTCKYVWSPKVNMGLAEKIWTVIFCAILVFVGCLCIYTASRRIIKNCKTTYNRRIFNRNLSERNNIEQRNIEILQHMGFQNAPSNNPRESGPPCYEDALLMPKIDRSKSMGELNSPKQQNKYKMQRANTNADLENESLVVDRNHFLSEERLLDREKERHELNFGYVRRQQRRLSDGSRLNQSDMRYDTRFPPAHMKSQNLESAERIAIIKNSRTSPYSSRKWKMHADSISFASISDDDLGIHRNSSRYNRKQDDTDSIGQPKQSPYSRRRPRGVSVSQLSISRENLYDEIPVLNSNITPPLPTSSSSSSSPSNPKINILENHFQNQREIKIESSGSSSEFNKNEIPCKEQSIESLNSEIQSTDDITATTNNNVNNLPIKQSKF